MAFENCGYKVKRCGVYRYCSIHYCVHTGVPISAKANRERNRQLGAKLSLSSKIKSRMQAVDTENDVSASGRNIIFETRECKAISYLVEALSTDQNFKHFLSVVTWPTEAEPLKIRRALFMVSLTIKCMKQICKVVYSANPEFLETELNKEKKLKSKSEEMITKMAP